jgi:23S rRNA (pseudouridine1915-N3)-methyltransferase
VEFLNFYIGNPEGFKNSVDKFEKLSLGKMTFPHSLARVILCEQIYRCATLLTNHPYHKS